ncbi:hypothetical protein HK100_000124 [Physocladia obscura]|uniref:Uncharacterized protein n=1 Tax=Physocladia obscura TaxID=109957 RepID=A0AAD5XCR5_9FUNG|nr:hypothetical protein HK100_000124 [Physocladia obscura]
MESRRAAAQEQQEVSWIATGVTWLTDSHSAADYNPFAESERAEADAVAPSAAELWTQRQGAPAANAHQDDEADALFAHPLYTPPAAPDVSLGPLAPGRGLQWPEFDQGGLLASTNPRVPSPPRQDPGFASFDDPLEAQIGAYPRVPQQFSELKDPFAYWDQQARRNYGDVLDDQFLQLNQWSHGPAPNPRIYVAAIVGVLALLAGVFAAVSAWDPLDHLWHAERDYPFNGLHLELGADPNNLDDTQVTARQYKNQFDKSYKPI